MSQPVQVESACYIQVLQDELEAVNKRLLMSLAINRQHAATIQALQEKLTEVSQAGGDGV